MTCDPSMWGDTITMWGDPITESMWGDPITEHVGRSNHHVGRSNHREHVGRSNHREHVGRSNHREHVGRSNHLLTIQADHHAVLPRARGDERDRVRAVGAVRHDHLYGARPVGARGDGGTSRGEIIRPTVASLHLWGEARAPW